MSIRGGGNQGSSGGGEPREPRRIHAWLLSKIPFAITEASRLAWGVDIEIFGTYRWCLSCQLQSCCQEEARAAVKNGGSFPAPSGLRGRADPRLWCCFAYDCNYTHRSTNCREWASISRWRFELCPPGQLKSVALVSKQLTSYERQQSPECKIARPLHDSKHINREVHKNTHVHGRVSKACAGILQCESIQVFGRQLCQISRKRNSSISTHPLSNIRVVSSLPVQQQTSESLPRHLCEHRELWQVCPIPGLDYGLSG